MKKIVLAFDSFKGSLRSEEAAECARAAVGRVFPGCETVVAVVADGGEGTAEAIVRALGGSRRTVRVHDPLMRPVEVQYGLVDDGRTAVMEMAAACGLTLLSPGERNPWRTSTYGLGEMIADALRAGCRKFLIGIGGSATNDGGCGMLRALGFRLLDADGRELDGAGGSLERLHAIDDRGVPGVLRDAEFLVACDVDNPLCGPQGAAHVFAPQKGADPQMTERLDRGLLRFADVAERYNGLPVAGLPGAGAAGGLGAGMCSLLHARLVPGIEMLLGAMDFDRMIAGADLILTGEGRLDEQTLHGKVPCGILRAARRQRIPVIALGGSVACAERLVAEGFAAVFPIVPGPVPLAEAMLPERAGANLGNTVEQILRTIRTFGRP